jgi:hypothetical protein
MPASHPTPPSRRSLLRWAVRGGVAGLGLTAILEFGNVLLGHNFHVVVPAQVYRSSQPSGPRLEDLIHTYGIRTVVNLRGCSDPVPWYLEECRATNRNGVAQEDLSFSAGRLPPVPEIRHLMEVIDGSDYPLLFHCYHGIDRTGLASTMALLLLTDVSLKEARRQLGLRYLHLPFGHTGNMDRFFDLYEDWLTAKELSHSRAAFRHWVANEYCPGPCCCRFEVLGLQGPPSVVRRCEPSLIRVRCHNLSGETWHFRPGKNAGIHARYQLLNGNDEGVTEGRAGLFRATVAPGNFIDLALALPALDAPGCYLLRADLMDEQHASFFQTGSEPLEWEVVVR